MAFRPNYNQQRADRDRAKQAKAEAKRQLQEQQKAERRRLQEGGAADPAEAMPETGEAPAAEPPEA